MNLEQKALKTTLIGNLSLGLLGIVFSLVASSEAVLLDGLFSFINFVMALISIRIANQVEQKDDEYFPFGYAVFEPILNISKGLILMAVSIYAATSAIDIIISGGQKASTSVVVIYALVSAFACSAYSVWLRRLNRYCKSPIISTDVENWMIDGLISGGVALAFSLVFLLRGTAFEFITPYVDPTLVVLIVALTLPIPIKVIRENWSQIIGATDPCLASDIRNVIETVLHDQGVLQLHVRQGRLGRVLYVQIYLVMATGNSMKLSDQDALRSRIDQSLQRIAEVLALDVIFTEESDWVRRSILPV